MGILRLVSPFNRGIGTRSQYYLASRVGGLQSPLLQPFARWLLAQAQEFHDSEYLPVTAHYQT